jgi:Asp-tRNA(Asn)/Glu-tRNA(Gln) amidotransferase A subunit family amidase
MNGSEYQKFDAVGLAHLVAEHEVTADELLDAALARLAAVNPKLNAVILTIEDQARRRIARGLPAGPFAGVPFLLKDAQMAGVVTNASSLLFANSVPVHDDCALVASYQRAGFVIFGKTNMPEFCLAAITEPALCGPTLNPWNLKLTCGGSSGGAASAVASGIVPAAQGSDAGGSIRIPASCCGLFGFKPSRGRVSMAPEREGSGGANILHAVTRSVRDSAAILDVSCRPEPGDPYYLSPPERPFSEEVALDPPSLRIAVLRTSLSGRPIGTDCTAAVGDAGLLCESLGHNVEEAWLALDTESLTPAVMKIVGTNLVADLNAEAARRGRAIETDEIEPSTRMFYDEGLSCSGAQYVQALQSYNAVSRAVAPFFARYDVLLLSTLGSLPIPVGMLKGGLGELKDVMARYLEYAPNTLLFNITGQPAMSVPLTWNEENVPIGVQFVARAGAEAMLFRLAGQLERARPWAMRRPPEIPW